MGIIDLILQLPLPLPAEVWQNLALFRENDSFTGTPM